MPFAVNKPQTRPQTRIKKDRLVKEELNEGESNHLYLSIRWETRERQTKWRVSLRQTGVSKIQAGSTPAIGLIVKDKVTLKSVKLMLMVDSRHHVKQMNFYKASDSSYK